MADPPLCLTTRGERHGRCRLLTSVPAVSYHERFSSGCHTHCGPYPLRKPQSLRTLRALIAYRWRNEFDWFVNNYRRKVHTFSSIELWGQRRRLEQIVAIICLPLPLSEKGCSSIMGSITLRISFAMAVPLRLRSLQTAGFEDEPPVSEELPSRPCRSRCKISRFLAYRSSTALCTSCT